MWREDLHDFLRRLVVPRIYLENEIPPLRSSRASVRVSFVAFSFGCQLKADFAAERPVKSAGCPPPPLRNKLTTNMALNLSKNQDDLQKAAGAVVDNSSPINWWVSPCNVQKPWLSRERRESLLVFRSSVYLQGRFWIWRPFEYSPGYGYGRWVIFFFEVYLTTVICLSVNATSKPPKCRITCLVSFAWVLSIDWLIDWAADWLFGWLIDWLIGKHVFSTLNRDVLHKSSGTFWFAASVVCLQ